jgi:two-component system sensor histidine kinase CpxA
VRSIFLKIFLWFWLTMVLIALAFVFVWSLESEAAPSRQSLTANALGLYAGLAARTFESEGLQATNNLMQRLSLDSRGHAVLLDEGLRSLGGDLANPDSETLQSAKATGQPQIASRGELLYVVTTTQGPSGKRYFLAAQLPRRTSGGIFRGSPQQQFLRWTIAILISGLVCYTLTRYLIQPVLRLRTAAGSIAAGDFSARATPNLAARRDEMGDLVRDFNQMAERIERLMEAQQQLLRDVSHELRSPLARLNVALELARKRAGEQAAPSLDRIEQESERLNEMIGRLLTLARIKALVDPPQHGSISMRAIIDQIAQDAGFEASAKNCHVQVTGADDCQVQGSQELLHSSIENVVRNAVRHAPSGTGVDIDLKCDGKMARVVVRDQGPGVPEAELTKIFRPFYRLSDAREHRSGGTGIGLAITQEVVRLHGGSVTARNAKPGLIVEIELPYTGQKLTSSARSAQPAARL